MRYIGSIPLRIFLLGTILLPSVAAEFAEPVRLDADSRVEQGQFGGAVSVLDNMLVIGACGDIAYKDGTNPLHHAGAAYIFKKLDGTWETVQKITSESRSAQERFGSAVCLGEQYLVIGAEGHTLDAAGENPKGKAGTAFIYEKDNSGQWSFMWKIVSEDRAANDRFGASVTVSGNYVVVGAPGKDDSQGAAYVFEPDQHGKWYQLQKLTSFKSFYPTYGRVLDMCGDRLIVGSPSQVYSTTDPIFHYNFAGTAYIYELNESSGKFEEVALLGAPDIAEKDHFASSVSISGDWAFIGTPDKATDENQKNSLAAAGALYIAHRRNDGTWEIVQKITPEDRDKGDQFGASVSVSGKTGVVGATYENEDVNGKNPINNAGAVYFLKRNNDEWAISQKLVAPNRTEEAAFGWVVSVCEPNVLVGVPFDNPTSGGTDSVRNAGAAYVFEPRSAVSIHEAGAVRHDGVELTTVMDVNRLSVHELPNRSIITLFDMSGREVYRAIGEAGKASLSTISPGMYVTSIRTEGKTLISRIAIPMSR